VLCWCAEDKHLLAGHICLLNRDYAKAQSLFLNSSAPLTALDMRKDLLEWAIAEKLAATLAPQQIPFICKEYAQQLEVKGEYAQALMMYTRAHDELKDVKADPEHLRYVCVCCVLLVLWDLTLLVMMCGVAHTARRKPVSHA
jgi:hypothetical protein